MTRRTQTVCWDDNLKSICWPLSYWLVTPGSQPSSWCFSVPHVSPPLLPDATGSFENALLEPVKDLSEPPTPGWIWIEGSDREHLLPSFCSASWTHLEKDSGSLQRFPWTRQMMWMKHLPQATFNLCKQLLLIRWDLSNSQTIPSIAASCFFYFYAFDPFRKKRKEMAQRSTWLCIWTVGVPRLSRSAAFKQHALKKLYMLFFLVIIIIIIILVAHPTPPPPSLYFFSPSRPQKYMWVWNESRRAALTVCLSGRRVRVPRWAQWIDNLTEWLLVLANCALLKTHTHEPK